MADKDIRLMKGNEVIAHAAVRCGCDGYFGYPITPQSEVMETLMELRPWESTGMVVLRDSTVYIKKGSDSITVTGISFTFASMVRAVMLRYIG